jgi:hypothetical protein
MLSRALGLLAALSLAVVPMPSFAQETTPTKDAQIGGDQGTSDLLLMMGAIVGAALIALLATQIGGGKDKPASP